MMAYDGRGKQAVRACRYHTVFKHATKKGSVAA